MCGSDAAAAEGSAAIATADAAGAISALAAAKKGDACEVAEFCWSDFFLEEETEDRCCCCFWVYYSEAD